MRHYGNLGGIRRDPYSTLVANRRGDCCRAILRANNTVRVDAQFRFNLIAIDPDDNKFVDCAIVSNAAYIVTNDAHFNCLATIPFPRVDVCGIDEFLRELSDEDPIRS